MGKGLPVAALAIAEAPKEMADVATLNHFILPSRFLIFSLTFFIYFSYITLLKVFPLMQFLHLHILQTSKH